MKKIYPLLFLFLFTAGCSKDFLKRYEKRIVGTWQLVDVDRVGLGGSTSSLPFRDGEFVFGESGQLKYTDNSGNIYNGSWDIDRRWAGTDCYIDEYGHRNCNNKNVKSLYLTAVDFVSQDIKTEHFDEMVFTGTNRFKAYIYSGFHTYVFRFRR